MKQCMQNNQGSRQRNLAKELDMKSAKEPKIKIENSGKRTKKIERD